MRLATLALACTFASAVAALPAVAADPAAELPGAPGQQGPKQRAAGGAPADDGAEAVRRVGCVFRPGGRARLNVISSNRVTQYRVVPDRSFDAVLEVQYRGFGVNRTDRFFAGGTETLRIRSPGGLRFPVTVTVRGFRGSTGCFRLAVTP